MQNNTVTEVRGALRRKNLPEGCFYFFGLLKIVYETEPEFTDAVSKLLLDSELREDMSSKALEKAESFSGTRFAERTVELYQKVLQKHNCETRQ